MSVAAEPTTSLPGVPRTTGDSAGPGALPRLELRVERLQLTFRFTFAFHAREVRFEVAGADGAFERIFPETFSFHATRHDPTELFLQLDDLLSKPRLLGAGASTRDARNLMTRVLAAAPRYLDGLCDHLLEDGRAREQERPSSEAGDRTRGGRLQGAMRVRFHQDVALLSQVLLRFLETHELDGGRQIRVAGFSLRKRIYQSLRVLVDERVEKDYLQAYLEGRVELVDPGDDSTESGFFQVLETGEPEAVNRMVLRLAERAFYLWLEGVCLDEENAAFEKDDSPFGDREQEVLGAIAVSGTRRIDRSDDLMPFLRRSNRNCRRILGKLERWFLRVYDIRHSSVIIGHQAALIAAASAGRFDGGRVLTWHTPRIHAALLGLLVLPFLAATFAYARAPRFFDLIFTLEVSFVFLAATWFLLYRFCWKRDLSFFHASVPRIGAGIIVGYLPVFLIDEVWDLASRPNVALDAVVLLLGLVTLLYIYVEIARRIPDTTLAFARARSLFLLGVVEALCVGVVMTTLVGPFMVSRNWSPSAGEVGIEVLRDTMPLMIGQLPHIVGIAPVHVYPSALLLMTFLSFFIGIFLQLMWEELPITEPL